MTKIAELEAKLDLVPKSRIKTTDLEAGRTIINTTGEEAKHNPTTMITTTGRETK